MRSNSSARELTNSGTQAVGAFGISWKQQAHLMAILRDTLYTDKILAVLREYGANAWDAHRMSGKGDFPIKVTIPTSMQPTLVIRDFGPGLSEDEVFTVYTQYGESTKRDTDDAVGTLGIGSKSGFCYSDSFTVTSWNGGVKKVYVAVLDPSNTGLVQKMFEAPCGDETGLEIQIPIKVKDVLEFHQKAQFLFSVYDPSPDINVAVTPMSRDHQNGSIAIPTGAYYARQMKWTGVMGCVPYRIDMNQVQLELERLGLWKAVAEATGLLFFDIGEVHVSASREELKYSDATKKAIIARVQGLLEEYASDLSKLVDNTYLTAWERRIQATHISENLHIPVPVAYRDWARPSIPLWEGASEEPQSFQLLQERKASRYVHVNPETILYLKDCFPGKKVSLSHHARIVQPINKASLEKAQAELDAYLANAGLTGVPVKLLSSLPQTIPFKSRRGYAPKKDAPLNPKHSVKSFVLDASLSQFRHPWSSNWSIVDRVPTDDDVFLLMKNFAPGDNFYMDYRQARTIAAFLKEPLPPVYGYKILKDKTPVPTGTPWRIWHMGLLRRFVEHPHNVKLLEQRQLTKRFGSLGYRYRLERNFPQLLKDMQDSLGEGHEVYQVLSGVWTGHHSCARIPASTWASLDTALARLPTPTYRPETAAADSSEGYPSDDGWEDPLYQKYPLFKIAGLLETFSSDKFRNEWVDYIKMCDNQTQRVETP